MNGGGGGGIFRLLFTLLILLFFLGIIAVAAYLGYQWYQNQQTGMVPIIVSNSTTTTTLPSVDSVRIATWNIQRFGKTKATNDELVKWYVSKIKEYDVIVLQEIVDESGYAPTKICYLMDGYACKVSERRGNSTYKEQYIILYNSKVNLKKFDDNPMLTGYQRPPVRALFTSGNWTFELTTMHTTPSAVHSELSNLQFYVLDDFIGDKIVIGDLNADCAYYDNIVDFTMWNWVNDGDTTVSSTDCAYDRIIINKAATNNYLTHGVMTDVPATRSDHYLLYGVFKNNEP